MAHETLQEIVGSAIVNPRFRYQLLTTGADALADFDLTAEEVEAITTIRAETLQGFAQQLHDWITHKEVPPKICTT